MPLPCAIAALTLALTVTLTLTHTITEFDPRIGRIHISLLTLTLILNGLA